ncbi:MAG: hypothetical protein ACRDNY_10655 [Gaiellaceae bacterium]
MTADVESARRDWEDAYRRLGEAARERAPAEELHAGLAAVTDELRKRIGSKFTLGELAAEYHRADDWARSAVAEKALPPGWLGTLSVVEGAAFHIYSRGAVDYRP